MAKKPSLTDELLQVDEATKELLDMDADARVRTLRKQVASLQRKLSAKDTGRDLLRDTFFEAYSDPLDIRVPTPPKDKRRKTVEIPVLHITDVHFGKRTADYNIAVAEERMRKLTNTAIELVNIRRGFAKIDELRIYLGGDFGEGEGEIFPGQQHEIDQDIVGQVVKEGPRILCEQFLAMLGQFRTIKVLGVPGNHGKTGKQAAKRNNYDNWFYQGLRQTVEIALSDKDRRRITWDLPWDRQHDEWYAYDRLFDRWGCLLVHGDQVRGMLGFPWYGFGKKVAGWIDVVPHPWQYLFSGHFHTHASFTINRRTVLAGGTPESSNAYAAESLAAGGDPVQRLAFFNEAHGLIVDAPIYLSEREPTR